MQKENQNSLYSVLQKVVPDKVMSSKNRHRSWQYGYNDKYDIVIISKDGTIGDIYNINGLKVALPSKPKKFIKDPLHKKNNIGSLKNIQKN